MPLDLPCPVADTSQCRQILTIYSPHFSTPEVSYPGSQTCILSCLTACLCHTPVTPSLVTHHPERAAAVDTPPQHTRPISQRRLACISPCCTAITRHTSFDSTLVSSRFNHLTDLPLRPVLELRPLPIQRSAMRSSCVGSSRSHLNALCANGLTQVSRVHPQRVTSSSGKS